MKNVTLEQLLEAGAHFGHQVTRQNPKARDFVFEARDNIHIIDLAKTKEGLDEAANFVKELSKRGGTMIILGAKRQAEPVVKDAAKRVKEAGAAGEGLYFVTNRWIGGILTNYPEVSKNFKRLKDLYKFMDTPSEKARFTKKEVSLMDKERQKLDTFYWGVQDLKHIPDAVFIIDTHLEDLAVREAIATGVVRVGITDTNSDPTLIDYPIPANDDAVGSVQLILDHIVEAWMEGRKAGIEQRAKSEEQGAKEAEKAAKTEEKRMANGVGQIGEPKKTETKVKTVAKKVEPKKATVKTEKVAPVKKVPAKKATKKTTTGK